MATKSKIPVSTVLMGQIAKNALVYGVEGLLEGREIGKDEQDELIYTASIFQQLIDESEGLEFQAINSTTRKMLEQLDELANLAVNFSYIQIVNV